MPLVEHEKHRDAPVWIGVLAVICVLVSIGVAFGAMIFLIVDCNEDSQSVCSTGGYGQFAVALLGVALSFGAVIAGLVGRTRPGAWLCAAALSFAAWLLIIFAVGETA